MTAKPTYEEIEASVRALEDKLIECQQGNETLRRAEQKLQQQLSRLPVGIYRNTSGLPGRFIMANKTIASMFGYESSEEFMKINVSDLYVEPKEREAVSNKLLFKGAVSGVELRLKRKDGSQFWGSVTAKVIRNKYGDVEYFDGIIEDITDRKHAETANQKEHDFISNVLYWTDSLVVVIDLRGFIVNFNRASEQLSGYRFQEVQDTPFWDILVDPDEKEGVKRIIEEVALRGLSKDFKNYWLTKAGKRRLIHWRNSALKNPDGSIEHILCTGLDITERHEAEKALKESEANYRELVQNANSIIARFDVDGKFTFFNEYAQKFFGYGEKEIIGKHLVGTIIPETDTSGRSLSSLISEIVRNPETYASYENENMLRSGQRVWVSWTNKAIYGPDGKLVEILCIGNDITQRKRLETQLQQTQKMESFGILAGGIAHDFNNILASVIGNTELALDEVQKNTAVENSLQEIYSAGIRAKDLVRQILTFARQSKEEVSPLQLGAVLNETLKFMRSSIPTSIEIEKNFQSESSVMGNETQLQQVIVNLCTNAAHAMEEAGGIIAVSLSDVEITNGKDEVGRHLENGHYAMLKVSDTGSGISPKDINHIFEPYFTTKKRGEGTGMGLAIVHGILEAYGSKITVDSVLGEGSTFTIYFRRTKKQKSPIKHEHEQLPVGNESILLVDDEVSITRMGSQILKKLGYSVTTSTKSLKALGLFQKKPDDFDLIITDMTMPNMTGDLLAIEIMKIRPDIPVILCTGYSKKISDELITQTGIKAVAHKPIVKAKLAKMVREVLDEANSSRTS